MIGTKSLTLAALALASCACAQTFQRLGACPKLGCVFPPDKANFLAGQAFDIRVEIHAPTNGSEAFNGGKPDETFTFQISKDGGKAVDVAEYFKVEAPALERWNFTYFEDLFAQDNEQPTLVNVAAKAYRHIALYEPGEYKAILTYYDGSTTEACWKVREPSGKRKAKNVIFFIGDGMAPSMITAARLIGHKSINGEYQSLMQMDQMEALGHQMTHSIDSYITDSANSATALYTGKKSTVNALNVYVDSSADPFDDPKFEALGELMHRVNGGKVGIVSTAYLADATPAAVVTHTRLRGAYEEIVDQYYRGVQNYSWTQWDGPDVLLGGGAENFNGSEAYRGNNYFDLFSEKGYNVVFDKDQLDGASEDKRLLGLFCTSNMDKWLDRNVYPQNTRGNENSPKQDGSDADNQPGLKAMTLKAIDVLSKRAKADGDKGFFLMSEAASIDKMMHAMDYDRALGELLELDETIKATLQHLKDIGEADDTLVVVTADHGHGFDVFGSSDSQYLAQADGDRQKRRAIGTYEQSGLSEYQVAKGQSPTNHSVVFGPQGPGYPVQWDPRYTFAAGFGAHPDVRENYTVHENGIREPAAEIEGLDGPYDGAYVNPEDGLNGFVSNGTLPVENGQGVHSLADVAVFASGPGAQTFAGVYNSIDVFFKIADVLDLGRKTNVTCYPDSEKSNGKGKGKGN